MSHSQSVLPIWEAKGDAGDRLPRETSLSLIWYICIAVEAASSDDPILLQVSAIVATEAHSAPGRQHLPSRSYAKNATCGCSRACVPDTGLRLGSAQWAFLSERPMLLQPCNNFRGCRDRGGVHGSFLELPDYFRCENKTQTWMCGTDWTHLSLHHGIHKKKWVQLDKWEIVFVICVMCTEPGVCVMWMINALVHYGWQARQREKCCLNVKRQHKAMCVVKCGGSPQCGLILKLA